MPTVDDEYCIEPEGVEDDLEDILLFKFEVGYKDNLKRLKGVDKLNYILYLSKMYSESILKESKEVRQVLYKTINPINNCLQNHFNGDKGYQ